MELALLVYLLGLVEDLDILLSRIEVTLVVVLILAFLVYIPAKTTFSYSNDKDLLSIEKIIKITGIALLVSMVIQTFIPSKNTFTMMIGAYAGQKVIEHPKTSELFDKSLKAIETQLDVLIAPPKKEEKGG
ncbi:hypothetical protein K7G91_000892 [Pasteurella canis]|uniref:hypothetical protein n=1 Tax=Pasteurella canis TaxID=753 RepID=UPI001D125D32|nr:hypothetical protein [Pasteurella canis]UDW84606.1 hypothetical protein K7G91_000892 [Pasteurella canis]